MKQNEKIIIASILCGIITLLFGISGLVCYYFQWPFENFVYPDTLQPEWIARGGLFFAELMTDLCFVALGFLLLFLSSRGTLRRPQIVWAGGIRILILLIVVFVCFAHKSDVFVMIPMASFVYFLGFVQGVILCFARGEKKA